MITVTKYNEAQVILDSNDRGILREAYEYFSFYAPGYKFSPAFRNKYWDGKIRLFNLRTQTLPYGLLEKLNRFCEERSYTLNYDFSLKTKIPSIEECEEFLNNLQLTVGTKEIKSRDYQKDAFIHAVRNKRAILVSPTGSGKSLIIYKLIRFYFANNFTNGKIPIVIVPTTSLVEQMAKDFLDYSQKEDPISIHKIYSGKEKFNIDADVVITTWQTAIRLPKSWFTQFGMVIGDEAHTFKAKSLVEIMNRLTEANYRIGTTGTIDDEYVNRLVLEGSFGPLYHVTSTRELMDRDTLAKLNIKCIVLKYSEKERNTTKKYTYPEEIDYIVSHEKRNTFIKNLAIDQKGNTLVLYTLVVKHGKPLYEAIQKKCDKNRKVFFVSGAVNAEERERIREITEKEKNAIIVASVGTFSTGINIVNINNIIFTSPTKSQIRVLQSIGRGLRRTEDGKPTTVFDIADDLSWKKRKNYTLKHAITRMKIYLKEKFNPKTYEVQL